MGALRPGPAADLDQPTRHPSGRCRTSHVACIGAGRAMAIEDAYVLARALSSAREDIGLALRAYEAARVPRTTQVQLASRKQAEIFHQHSGRSADLPVDWIYQYDPTSIPMAVSDVRATDLP